MGEGFFGISRPGTVEDKGWFGAPRPLVGAANGIKATVTTKSAATVGANNETPQSVQNIKVELNSVKKEKDRVESKIEKLVEYRDRPYIDRDPAVLDDSLANGGLNRRIESLIQESNNLDEQMQRLQNSLQVQKEDVKDGILPPDEVEDTLFEPVNNQLVGMGVSKGPFINVKGESTEIIFSITGIREEDVAETRSRLQDLGLQVSNVEAIEV